MSPTSAVGSAPLPYTLFGNLTSPPLSHRLTHPRPLRVYANFFAHFSSAPSSSAIVLKNLYHHLHPAKSFYLRGSLSRPCRTERGLAFFLVLICDATRTSLPPPPSSTSPCTPDNRLTQCRSTWPPLITIYFSTTRKLNTDRRFRSPHQGYPMLENSIIRSLPCQ